MRMPFTGTSEVTVSEKGGGARIVFTDDPAARVVTDPALPAPLIEPAAAINALKAAKAGKTITFYGLPKWFEGDPLLESPGAVVISLTKQGGNVPANASPEVLHRAAVHTALAKMAVAKGIPIRWSGSGPVPDSSASGVQPRVVPTISPATPKPNKASPFGSDAGIMPSSAAGQTPRATDFLGGRPADADNDVVSDDSEEFEEGSDV